MAEKGCVYIMTNPSFRDNWVKIGYTDNLEQRLRDLSCATGVPLPFEIYAYARTAKYKELEEVLHRMIEQVSTELDENNNLRINPKKEFFNITPQHAYNLLEVQAKLIDDVELKLCGQGDDDSGEDEKSREEPNVVATAKKLTRGENTTFEFLQIPVGVELVFRDDNTKKAVVKNQKNLIRIIGENKDYSITGATIKLRDELNLWSEENHFHRLNGWNFWLYRGEILWKIRERIIREMAIQSREKEIKK